MVKWGKTVGMIEMLMSEVLFSAGGSDQVS